MGEYGNNIWGNSKMQFVYSGQGYIKPPATGDLGSNTATGVRISGLMIRNFSSPQNYQGGIGIAKFLSVVKLTTPAYQIGKSSRLPII